MPPKKLSSQEVIKQAIVSYIRHLKNLEKSVDKAIAINKDMKAMLSVLIFGRENVDIQKEFAKRIGFAKIALKQIDGEVK